MRFQESIEPDSIDGKIFAQLIANPEGLSQNAIYKAKPKIAAKTTIEKHLGSMLRKGLVSKTHFGQGHSGGWKFTDLGFSLYQDGTLKLATKINVTVEVQPDYWSQVEEELGKERAETMRKKFDEVMKNNLARQELGNFLNTLMVSYIRSLDVGSDKDVRLWTFGKPFYDGRYTFFLALPENFAHLIETLKKEGKIKDDFHLAQILSYATVGLIKSLFNGRNAKEYIINFKFYKTKDGPISHLLTKNEFMDCYEKLKEQIGSGKGGNI